MTMPQYVLRKHVPSQFGIVLVDVPLEARIFLVTGPVGV
jgi:Ni,Fe-hydrogenase III small subunit